jgi:hypothetical protein
MARRAISVTLESDNVIWLKGRAGSTGESVSALLDQIVTTARKEMRPGSARSVAGTIDIDSSDPLLERADAAVRALFDASLGRPVIAREQTVRYRGRTKGGRKPRA